MHPDICTQFHFVLSELFISRDIVPESPLFQKEDDDIKEKINEANKIRAVNQANIEDQPVEGITTDGSRVLDGSQTEENKTILNDDVVLSNNHSLGSKSSLSDFSTEERCLSALRHLALALDSLKFQIYKRKEEEVVTSKPSEAIPKLSEASKPTQKEKKRDKKKSPKNNNSNVQIATNAKAQPLQARQDFHGDEESWRDQLKIQLYEKIKLVYATLIEYYFKNNDYGAGMRCLGLLVRCNQIGTNISSSSNTFVMSSLFTKAGDYCTMYAQNWNKAEFYQESYATYSEQDEKIIKQLEGDENKYGGGTTDLNWVLGNENVTLQHVLERGIQHYSEALKHQMRNSIYLKLGNAYIALANYLLDQIPIPNLALITPSLWKRVNGNLDKALINFEKGGSELSLNCALVYYKRANLHRSLARLDVGRNAKLDDNRQLEYNSAISNYQTALRILNKSKDSKGRTLWEKVHWNLTSTKFIGALRLYGSIHSAPHLDNWGDIQTTCALLEQIVVYCQVWRSNPFFVKYQIVLGRSSLYMANLKFLMLVKRKNCNISNHQTKIKTLYSKAVNCFVEVKELTMLLVTISDELGFCLHLTSATEDPEQKILHLKAGLQSTFSIRILIQSNFNLATNEMANILAQFLEKIKPLLQAILLKFLKVIPANRPNIQKVYKECYRKSLYIPTQHNSAREAIQNLFLVLEKIERDLRNSKEIV